MDIKQAELHFKKVDKTLHKALLKHKHELTPRTVLRTNQQLFEALCESVVSQQLAVKAADAIWARVVKVCGGKVTPEKIRTIRIARLRSCGLSNAKAKTLKAVAKEMQNGLSLTSLRKKTPEEAHDALTKIWGIGPWTCEMFLMFALSHPDIFSSRDLGLVRAMEGLYKLPRTTPREKLEVIAQKWSPHRTLACRILWKSRDSK